MIGRVDAKEPLIERVMSERYEVHRNTDPSIRHLSDETIPVDRQRAGLDPDDVKVPGAVDLGSRDGRDNTRQTGEGLLVFIHDPHPRCLHLVETSELHETE